MTFQYQCQIVDYIVIANSIFKLKSQLDTHMHKRNQLRFIITFIYENRAWMTPSYSTIEHTTEFYRKKLTANEINLNKKTNVIRLRLMTDN